MDAAVRASFTSFLFRPVTIAAQSFQLTYPKDVVFLHYFFLFVKL